MKSNFRNKAQLSYSYSQDNVNTLKNNCIESNLSDIELTVGESKSFFKIITASPTVVRGEIYAYEYILVYQDNKEMTTLTFTSKFCKHSTCQLQYVVGFYNDSIPLNVSAEETSTPKTYLFTVTKKDNSSFQQYDVVIIQVMSKIDSGIQVTPNTPPQIDPLIGKEIQHSCIATLIYKHEENESLSCGKNLSIVEACIWCEKQVLPSDYVQEQEPVDLIIHLYNTGNTDTTIVLNELLPPYIHVDINDKSVEVYDLTDGTEIPSSFGDVNFFSDSRLLSITDIFVPKRKEIAPNDYAIGTIKVIIHGYYSVL